MEESNVVGETTVEKAVFALVVDAFDPVEGLRAIYAAFGPFSEEELDEAEADLLHLGEELLAEGPLLWGPSGAPAVDFGISRRILEPRIPSVEDARTELGR
jgi:hypothetical protein